MDSSSEEHVRPGIVNVGFRIAHGNVGRGVLNVRVVAPHENARTDAPYVGLSTMVDAKPGIPNVGVSTAHKDVRPDGFNVGESQTHEHIRHDVFNVGSGVPLTNLSRYR